MKSIEANLSTCKLITKKLITMLVVMIAISQVHSQIQSDCTIPPELITYYDRDIKNLAVCRLFETHSPDTALVKIPRGNIDTIAEGMASIFNALSVVPEIDSVFNLYCIHNKFGCLRDYDGYIVKVDLDYSWTNAWQNMQTLTGDPLMDTILVRYSLHLELFYPFGSFAVIDSDSTWNPFALCDSLEIVPGVIYAERNSFGGDGHYIEYNIMSDEQYYIFSYKWGDCYAGCTCYYKWKFKVNSECQVTYLGVENTIGEYCPELPEPINCNLFTTATRSYYDNGFFIYPNPGKDKIFISIPNNNKTCLLTLYSFNGNIVLERNISETKTQIDLSNLPSGVYFACLQNGKMQEVKKILKE